MAALVSQVEFPENFQALFSAWNRFPEAEIFAGGNEFMRKQGRRFPLLPQNLISLDKMTELQKISRTERYLEIGSMVRLNQIAQLGKIVPEALNLCIENVAGTHIRNVATTGGNICNSNRRFDLSAPMFALDAQFELRSATSSKWISATRFLSPIGPPALAAHEILTRIRVPLEPWTYTWFYKFSCTNLDDPGGCILFMIRTQKKTLSKIRVVYAGKAILREKNCETMFEGKNLPLNKNQAGIFVDKWKSYLSTFVGNENSIYPGEDDNFSGELAKNRILNFIETKLHHISD